MDFAKLAAKLSPVMVAVCEIWHFLKPVLLSAAKAAGVG